MSLNLLSSSLFANKYFYKYILLNTVLEVLIIKLKLAQYLQRHFTDIVKIISNPSIINQILLKGQLYFFQEIYKQFRYLQKKEIIGKQSYQQAKTKQYQQIQVKVKTIRMRSHQQKQPTTKPYLLTRTLTLPFSMQLKILVQIFDPLPSQIIGKQVLSKKSNKKANKSLKRSKQQHSISLNSGQQKQKQHNLNFNIAYITIYTQRMVYQGTLTLYEINQQLAWTAESIAILEEALKGKRSKVQVLFYPIVDLNDDNKNEGKQQNRIEQILIDDNQYYKKQQLLKPSYKSNSYNIGQQPLKNYSRNNNNKKAPQFQQKQIYYENFFFQMVCQIKSGINLQLFKLQTVKALRISEYNQPSAIFSHMKYKLLKIDYLFKKTQQNYHNKQIEYKQKFNEISVLEKQIKDSALIEINVMKTNFIKIINSCKLEIRKFIGGQLPTIDPKNGMVDMARRRNGGEGHKNRNDKNMNQIDQKEEEYDGDNQENKKEKYQKQKMHRKQKMEQKVFQQKGNNKIKKTHINNRIISKVDKKSMLKRCHPRMQIQSSQPPQDNLPLILNNHHKSRQQSSGNNIYYGNQSSSQQRMMKKSQNYNFKNYQKNLKYNQPAINQGYRQEEQYNSSDEEDMGLRSRDNDGYGNGRFDQDKPFLELELQKNKQKGQKQNQGKQQVWNQLFGS